MQNYQKKTQVGNVINLGSSEVVIKRRRLFKKSKPFIRPFEKADMWVLWAAYKEGSFDLPPNMTKEVLYGHMMKALGGYTSLMLVEDFNKRFKDQRGAVCLITVMSDGWKMEPFAHWFSWATKLNILRANVRFLKWIMHSKEVGVCVFQATEQTVNLYMHVRRYGVLNYVGKIPGGARNGNLYAFSIRGKLEGRGDDGHRIAATPHTTRPTTTGHATPTSAGNAAAGTTDAAASAGDASAGNAPPTWTATSASASYAAAGS